MDFWVILYGKIDRLIGITSGQWLAIKFLFHTHPSFLLCLWASAYVTSPAWRIKSFRSLKSSRERNEKKKVSQLSFPSKDRLINYYGNNMYGHNKNQINGKYHRRTNHAGWWVTLIIFFFSGSGPSVSISPESSKFQS